MKLSVLDQSVSVAGSSEDAAIRDTLDLAQHCERLGYSRFWVSEHHGLPVIIGRAPEILMAALRSMPGVCAVLESSESATITRTPSFFH